MTNNNEGAKNMNTVEMYINNKLAITFTVKAKTPKGINNELARLSVAIPDSAILKLILNRPLIVLSNCVKTGNE